MAISDTGWTLVKTGEWERGAPGGLGGTSGDPDPSGFSGLKYNENPVSRGNAVIGR